MVEIVNPLLRFLVSPVDPLASYRTPWCLSEVFSGLFRAGSDGGQEVGDGSFSVDQYQSQSAFASVSGPLLFVRFRGDGMVEYGVQAALDMLPRTELGGITVQLRTELLQNRMEGDDEFSPDSPQDAPALLWRSEQGTDWETVIPARAPVVASVRHRTTPYNRTVKIRTVAPWVESQGFEARFDLNGVPAAHKGDAAIRLSWGDKYSLVFRGQGAAARPRLELRTLGKWKLVKVLEQNNPIDIAFWNSIHSLKVWRCGDRMILEWDGVQYWIAEAASEGTEMKARQVSWPKAPLRLNVVGATCNFQIHRLTGLQAAVGEAEPDPVKMTLRRFVPAPDRPFNNALQDFTIERDKTVLAAGVSARLHGSYLDGVRLAGAWEDEFAFYDLALTCSPIEAPLLCAFAVQFPAPALGAPPEAIDFFKAISDWSVDSGDPEALPDGQARFTVSVSQLKALIPNWETALLPYRPILIQAKYPNQATWTNLFDGFLTPESAVREGWNDYEVPMEARGHLLKLMEPYGLVDERYAPLDLQISAEKERLYGAEAVRGILRVELGDAAVANFNGNGDALRYLREPFPLLGPEGSGYFEAAQIPRSGNFRLPPPYGEYLKSWIDTLAEFDHAVFFYDARDRAFYYGRIVEFLIERTDQEWKVSEDVPSERKTTQEWPLLSSMTASGLLEGAYNDVRVWSAPDPGSEQFRPGALMGRAGDGDEDSVDPLSVAQSGRRTLLMKPDIVKRATVDQAYVDSLAYWTWREFKGKPPKRVDLQFDTGFLGPRWGELLTLQTGFAGPQHGGATETLRILQVRHKGSMSGEGNWFETLITASALSGSGQ